MKKNISIIMLISILLYSCDFVSLMDGGTHGSLGAYSFEISKDSLEKAINEVIKNNKAITKLKIDSFISTKIVIKKHDSYYFVFRFSGDKEYWKSHPNNSAIFITAIKKGNSKYESESEVSRKRKKELIFIFEKYFISPLNKLQSRNY